MSGKALLTNVNRDLNPAVIIREAIASEAEALWQLTRQAFEPDRDRLDPPSGVFKETADDVGRAMVEGAIFVALRGGTPVGAARVRPADRVDELYCGRVAVAPLARRRGIGTALMGHVEHYAAETGCSSVVVGVRIGLPENLRFYQRLGYIAVGEAGHEGYTQPTFVWMRKELQ